MRRLSLSLHKKNISPYVDIFLNHGSILVFPWLMAHHHSFFGSFDDLAILDVLLTHKRGYNLKIGSKKRKHYFSDVNHILRSVSEQPIACCEVFKPTEHYSKTIDLKDCLIATHHVSENEGFEAYNDSFESLFDVNELPPKKNKEKKIIIEEDSIKEGNNHGMALLIKKFLEFSKKSLNEVFSDDQQKEIVRIKSLRAEKINLIEKEIKSIQEEIDSIPPCRKFVLKRNLDQDSVQRMTHLKTIISKTLIFLKEHEYVLEPLNLITDMYNNNPVDFFSESNRKYHRLVSDYFKRKQEKRFLNIGEIEHLCNKYYLKERVDFYNLKFDEYSEIRKICQEKQKRGETPPKSDFLSARDIKDRLQAEVEPLIRLYDSIDESFEKEEVFRRPKNMKQIINFINNKDNEVDDFWCLIRRGDQNNDNLTEGLEALLSKLDNDCLLIGKGKDENLVKLIDEICESVKNRILCDLNEARDLDKTYIQSKSNEIKELRKKHIRDMDHGVLDFEHLHLSELEKSELDDAINFMVQKEQAYCNSVRRMKEKTVPAVVDDHNKDVFFRREGIPKNLNDEEWLMRVFEVEKHSYIGQIRAFEKCVAKFEEICGVSPYGLVIGSYGYDGVMRTCGEPEIDLRNSESNRNMFENIVSIAQKQAKGFTSIEGMGMSYLEITKKGMNRDWNFNANEKRGILRGKLTLKNKEKARIEEKGSLETLYDTIQSNDEESNAKLVRKSGIKIINPVSNPIETHYKVKVANRKKSQDMFKEIVSGFALKCKNTYEELEIEEAIVDSNEIVDKLFECDYVPYYLSDFKRMRLYRMEKNRMRMKAEEDGIKGIDLIKCYNEFDIEHFSNNNKKYDVSEAISYIKILLAFKILKINANAEIYKKFGFKKCQSNYARNNLIGLAQRMLRAFAFKAY